MTDIEAIAQEMFALLGTGASIAPVTGRNSDFTLEDAHQVAERVRILREGRGERVVGRKISFTNTTIWPLYGISAPGWGYVYDTTMFDLGSVPQPFPVAQFSEPRIEPEVVFQLKAAPRAGMSEGEILRCCEWVAHGFEIVQSVFPGWRFKGEDTVAAYGLHAALFVGPKHAVADDPDRWEAELRSFTVDLFCNGELKDRGSGSNVLGSPVLALKHLVESLALTPILPQLRAGEVVTTGTLTDAGPVVAGQSWRTELRGVPLDPASLSFR
jgi:2-oxo-3-hexenedioate decarboxylase